MSHRCSGSLFDNWKGDDIIENKMKREKYLKEIERIYKRWAFCYDLIPRTYLLGRDASYRRRAIQRLNLKRGDRVLEIGCATGLTFPFIREAIGEEGEIIGLDYSKALLRKAEERIKKKNWKNIRLVQQEASQLSLNEEVDGVLSIYTMPLVYDYREAIKRAVDLLKDNGRLVILSSKHTSGFFRFLNPLASLANRPFVPRGESSIKSWEEIWEIMRGLLREVKIESFFFDLIYLAWGTKKMRIVANFGTRINTN